MNDTERFEDRHLSEDARSASLFVFILLMTFFLLQLLFLTGSNTLQDPDTYWHLAVGRRIWQSGSVPRVDELSYTFQGHPWIANDWLCELLLFGAYSLGGWRTVVLMTACTIAATYALLYLVLSREMRLTVAVGVAAAAYAVSTPTFIARPQIFAFPLVIVWFAGLVRAIDAKSAPTLLLLPVITLWANVHGSFTFGLAFAGLLATEAVVDCEPADRIRTATRWAIFLAAALASACATPYGYQPILLTFQLLTNNEAQRFLKEWQPLFAQNALINQLLVLSLFPVLYFGVKVPLWRLLQILSLIYGTLSHVRLTSLFSIVTPILLMGPLSRRYGFLRPATNTEADKVSDVLLRASRNLLYPACSLPILAALGFGFLGPSISPKSDITPAGAVDYIVGNDLHGNIYNYYDFGGYLIFRGIKTFVDGRSDQLFLSGFMNRLGELLEKRPQEFVQYLQSHNISLALVQPGSIESRELGRSSAWHQAYHDDVSELYERVDN